MKKTLILPLLALALPFTLAAQEANSPNSTSSVSASTNPGGPRRHDGTINAPDGIARIQGVTQFLKNGKMTKVTYELKLDEGLTVRPDGQVTTKDGRTIQLQEGQMVSLDGSLGTAPKGLGSTAPSAASDHRRETGPATDYGLEGGAQNQPKPATAPSQPPSTQQPVQRGDGK